MRGRWRRSDSAHRGQAVTEFALVVPIFVFVMFALLELGRAVYFTQILDSAARDGARYAIVHGFEVAGCPSGPMPIKGATPNPCDPLGTNVINLVKTRAIGVADAAGFVVHVKWCDKTAMSAGTTQCGQTLDCPDWAGGGDPYPLGDGDNNRGQLVTVCVNYAYASVLKSLLPIPDFTVSARTDLVVNH